MIQDIAPHQFNNAYSMKRPPRKGDAILCYYKNKALFQSSENNISYLFPVFDGSCPEKNLVYLFSIDDTAYYLLDESVLPAEWLAGNIPAEAGYCWQEMQVFRTMTEGSTEPFIMMTGFHLYTWMRKNQYCGRCGHPTEAHKVERALSCPSCGNLIFPQISPAVAVAVTNGDKILLARSAQGGFRRFALIAGFVEIGETIEETIHREVLEEVGLRVKNPRYFKSQPWGLTGIEMLGFFVELDGSDQITLQESELSEAQWFTAEEVDRNTPLHSLSYTMIEEFCRRG